MSSALPLYACIMRIIRRGPDLQLQVECWAEGGKQNGKYLSTAGQAFPFTCTHSYIRTCNVCVPSYMHKPVGGHMPVSAKVEKPGSVSCCVSFSTRFFITIYTPNIFGVQSRSHGHLEVLGIHPKDLGRSICTPVEPRYTENIPCSSCSSYITL